LQPSVVFGFAVRAFALTEARDGEVHGGGGGYGRAQYDSRGGALAGGRAGLSGKTVTDKLYGSAAVASVIILYTAAAPTTIIGTHGFIIIITSIIIIAVIIIIITTPSVHGVRLYVHVVGRRPRYVCYYPLPLIGSRFITLSLRSAVS